MAAGAAEVTPRNLLDNQFYRAVDVSIRPSRRDWPLVVSGTHDGDEAPVPPRHPRPFNIGDAGYRAHNTNVYPERPDRAYLGYIDGGAVVLDISDISRPRMVAHWNPHPALSGFTHTVVPLFDRDLYVVSAESVHNDAADWPKLVWILDRRCDENLVPIAILPLPPGRGSRVPRWPLRRS